MIKNKILTGHLVAQGNGYGQSIERGSDDVLYTRDLIDCLAIILVDEHYCYMIHSDSNDAKGKGSTSLEARLRTLGLSENKHYTIGLIGGQSEKALSNKLAVLGKILPHINVSFMKSMVDGAYLAGNGSMAHTKKALAEKLGVESITLEEPPFNTSLRP